MCMCYSEFTVDEWVMFSNDRLVEDGFSMGIGKLYDVSYEKTCSVCGTSKWIYDLDLFFIKVPRIGWTNTKFLIHQDKRLREDYLTKFSKNKLDLFIEDIFTNIIFDVSRISMKEVKNIFGKDEFEQYYYNLKDISDDGMEEYDIAEILFILKDVKMNLHNIKNLNQSFLEHNA